MLEKVFGKWVAHKAFDMIEAEEQFEKYKKDLKLGELVIIEDETIKKVYIQDGKLNYKNNKNRFIYLI